MRIEIGRRAVNLYSHARDRVRQSRFYQVTVCSLKGIAPPPAVPPAASSTAVVHGAFAALNHAAELAAPRMVDAVRQAEDQTTVNIFGAESGGYLNRIRRGLHAFADNPTTLPYLAAASAAFYGMGLIVSAPVSSATLATAITITAAASTIAAVAFGSLHSFHTANPTLKKMVENLRTRGLLASLSTSLLTVPYLIYKSDMNIVNLFHAVPSWGIYGFLGTAGMVIAANVLKSCRDFHNSRMAMNEAPDKRQGRNMLIASKIAFYAKLGLLSYVAPMYLAALYGFSAAVSAMPICAATTVIGAYFMGKWAFNHNKDIKDGFVNATLGLGIGTIPLAILGGGSAAFYFPTLFVFAPLCMLMGNFHAGIPALSSATNHIGSLFYPAIPPLSDSFKEEIAYGVRGGKGRTVIRLNAFMKNEDTNFSNLINMLINPYPDVEFELCEEKKPWKDAGELKAVRTMKEFLAYWKGWQKEIYDPIKSAYENLGRLDPSDAEYQSKLKAEYQKLAELFEKLGSQFSGEFSARLQKLYEEKGGSWFNPGTDPLFLAEGLLQMKARAQNFFFPMAKRFRERAQAADLTSKELEKEYLRLLDIYSIRANYVIRRLEHLDDQINQKTNNLSFVLAHAGDTLYKVWVVSEDGKEFYVEHIPARYVRVDNPAYKHDNTAKRFLWVDREDLKKVCEPLRHSESGSEEIEFIDNTPAQTVKTLYKGIQVNAFASDEEVLPVKKPELRAFVKDGTTAADRLKGKYLWAPGMAKPAEFDRAFGAWIESKDADYKKNIPAGKLWYEDPEVLVFKAVDLNDYWFVSDEEYIDFASYVQLQAELQYDAHQQKDLRVFRYLPQKHEIPYPCPERPAQHILNTERMGGPIEIGYFDAQSQTRQIIPYQENRTLLPTDKLGQAKWPWQDVTHAKAVRKSGKKILELYSFTGRPNEAMKDGVNFHYVGAVPEDNYPDHLPPPENLAGQKLTFTAFPERVGMYGYYMFDFGENYGREPYQRYRFVRETEKPWQLWLNLITKMSLSGDKKTLAIESLYPEAQVVPFNFAWANPGEEGRDRLEVTAVSDSRNRVVAKYRRTDGSAYFEYAPSVEQLPPGSIGEPIILGEASAVGRIRYKKGGQIQESAVPLTGDLKGYHDPAKARDAVIGILTADQEIKVTRGRQFKFNQETAATYIYALKDHAKLVAPDGGTEVSIPNYNWIVDTYIEQRKIGAEDKYIVRITIENPFTHAREVKEIDGACLVDNEGLSLLANSSREMDSLDSFFQKRGEYSPAVERYRPEMVMVEGLPTLRLHAVEKEREILSLSEESKKALAEVVPQGAEDVEVYIASPASAAKVKEKESGREFWVPLSLVDPVDPRFLKGGNFNPGKVIIKESGYERVVYTQDIAAEKERQGNAPNVRYEEAVVFQPDIIHGDFAMVVHRQSSFGGSDAAEVRDQYFYARHFGPGCEIRYPQGEFDDPRVVIGLQGGKTNILDANRVSHSDAIENGTPFMANFRILFELSRITGVSRNGRLHPGNLEATVHHPFSRKIVTFSVFMGCLNGVSEDEELKKVMKKATGRKLRYSPYSTAVVSQPNEISKLKGQNGERYNTSSQLYTDIERRQVAREFWNGWIKHDMPRVYTPKEMLETFMTGFWYPGLPWSEIGQSTGPTAYLLSGGRIQPFIVDHLLFLTFLLADTPLSGINYGLARYHGGFSPGWSFWHAPARDPISLLGAYWRGSRRMIKEDWQYGQFVVTADQKGKSLPDSYKSFLRSFYASSGASNILGLASFAAAANIIGFSKATTYAVLAIFFNAFWGNYKFFLTREALKWLKIQERDLRDNPQTIDNLVAELQSRINENTSGRDKIFSLMEARHIAATALLDLGFDPFEVRNDPSRNNEQRRPLFQTAFAIDYQLYETACRLGKSADVSDRLLALGILKHLGKQSFSHDVGYYATRAYKRVTINRAEVSGVFNRKLADLRAEAEKPEVDLQKLSEHYFTAVSAWDNLDKDEQAISAGPIKSTSRNLLPKILQKLASMNINHVGDLLGLANLVGQIQPLLPLLGKKPLGKINQKVREKINAFCSAVALETLSDDDLNLLFSISALGCDKHNLKPANAIKGRVLAESYRRAAAAGKGYEELLNLQKEIALAAPDKAAKAQAQKAIQALFENELARIESIGEPAQKAAALRDAVEILAGYARVENGELKRVKDEKLSFESMPELKFIFDEIVPAFSARICKIAGECGSAAFEVVVAGENPDYGSAFDRAFGLKKNKVKLGRRKAEALARKMRKMILESLIKEAGAVQQAETDKTFTPELGKICDRLISLLTDFRATALAEEENGVIDSIEKLLRLERDAVSEGRAEAGAYRGRVQNFKGAVKIFIAKKYQKHPQLGDYYPVADRRITEKQKSEMSRYFEAIKRTFES